MSSIEIQTTAASSIRESIERLGAAKQALMGLPNSRCLIETLTSAIEELQHDEEDVLDTIDYMTGRKKYAAPISPTIKEIQSVTASDDDDISHEDHEAHDSNSSSSHQTTPETIDGTDDQENQTGATSSGPERKEKEPKVVPRKKRSSPKHAVVKKWRRLARCGRLESIIIS